MCGRECKGNCGVSGCRLRAPYPYIATTNIDVYGTLFGLLLLVAYLVYILLILLVTYLYFISEKNIKTSIKTE